MKGSAVVPISSSAGETSDSGALSLRDRQLEQLLKKHRAVLQDHPAGLKTLKPLMERFRELNKRLEHQDKNHARNAWIALSAGQVERAEMLAFLIYDTDERRAILLAAQDATDESHREQAAAEAAARIAAAEALEREVLT